MTMFVIDDTDAKKVLGQLKDQNAWTEVAVEIAQEAQQLISPYPPVRKRPQPFVSDRQRRFFFAALREGKIESPYRRGVSPNSESMINKWAIIPQRPGALLRNEASYASWVIGSKDSQQSRYHAGNWKSIEEMVHAIDQSGMAMRIINEYVEKVDS